MPARPLITLLVAAILASACTGAEVTDPLTTHQEGAVTQPDVVDTSRSTTTERPLPPIELATRPGPFQLTIDNAPDAVGPGTTLEAATVEGESLVVAEVAENGTSLLRNLPPGPVRLFVHDETGTRVAEARRQLIPGTGDTDAGDYDDAALGEGVNYITTRDGTTLSAYVTLPGSIDGGPYPTLIEYSGYAPSRPTGDDPSRLLLPALGYALVQVNVRGTGCSGGSFDAFEPIQSLDGYDTVETVAAQAWSGKIGLYGVSYAGIMQLHVASTRPPSLAAIAPLSVLDDVGSVLYPGGIYNPGFGEAWTAQVSAQAVAFGQGWERAQVNTGDDECERNQRLRVHNPDLVDRIRNMPFTTALSEERSPRTVVGSIEVPVFLAGAWQDEQTGGRWPALINEFDRAPLVRAMMYNGFHVDAIAPEVLAAVTEFYDLYLDDPDPGAGTVLGLILGAGLAAVFGERLPIPFERFDASQRDQVRRDYESADPIRVLFEQGATRANLPVPAFEASFAHWPPEAATATPLFFQLNGEEIVLGSDPDVATAPAAIVGQFTTDPDEGGRTTTTDLGGLWGNTPSWSWPDPTADRAIRATSEPLDRDLTVVGPASADLWLSSDGPDGDVEVTISEVQPDGSETYIQSGWLRLSQRALRPGSTELRPVPSGLERDVAPLTPGEPVLARVEILPFGHVFRAGSRLAVTIDTPGSSKPQWTFAVDPRPTTLSLHSSTQQPSRLVLPVIDGFRVPTPLPACGTLRAQPCRP